MEISRDILINLIEVGYFFPSRENKVCLQSQRLFYNLDYYSIKEAAVSDPESLICCEMAS